MQDHFITALCDSCLFFAFSEWNDFGWFSFFGFFDIESVHVLREGVQDYFRKVAVLKGGDDSLKCFSDIPEDEVDVDVVKACGHAHDCAVLTYEVLNGFSDVEECIGYEVFLYVFCGNAEENWCYREVQQVVQVAVFTKFVGCDQFFAACCACKDVASPSVLIIDVWFSCIGALFHQFRFRVDINFFSFFSEKVRKICQSHADSFFGKFLK